MVTRNFFIITFLFLSCLLLSCGKNKKTPVTTDNTEIKTGSISLKLIWQTKDNKKFTAPTNVTKVKIEISASDMTTISQEFTASAGTGTIKDVPAGTNRTITAKGLNNSDVCLYYGTKDNITVIAAQDYDAGTIVMGTDCNTTPVITAELSANPTSIFTSIANITSTISVTASDADGDTLTYTWSATNGTISGTESSVTYTAPSSAGTYTISVTVSDGRGGSVNGNVNITVTEPKTIQKISAGGLHTCAVLSDGTIKCWGENNYGQLGNGSNSSSNAPVSVTGINNATSIATGYMHTCALLSDGTIKCWGANGNGQLGNGTNINSSYVPVSVSGITNATSISSGGTDTGSHTCALLSDGTIKCWGHNGYGQLGNGTNTNSATPVSVSGITNAISIAASMHHSCAVLSEETVKCWGRNDFGQFGNGTNADSNVPVSVSGINNAVSTSVGGLHTYALLSDNTIKCWGYNSDGQLGNGTNINSNVPVSVSGISNATSVSAGLFHTCALLSDNTIKCWGYNSDGQLGNGTNNDSNIPISVSGISTATNVSAGYGHTCAVLSDGTVKCWGDNNHGQLGDGTTTSSNVPVSVDSSLYAFNNPNKFLMEKIYLADKSADYSKPDKSGNYDLCDKSHRYKPFRVDNVFKAEALSYKNYFLAYTNTPKNKLFNDLWFY